MDGYEYLAVHRTMLQDGVRTNAYRDAIREVVRPGDRVIDFGCGTGILSFFASQCGAREVDAIESTKIIRVAKAVAEQNRLLNINFHSGRGETIELPEKADVIISEWMGHFVFFEWMLPPLLRIRDNFLAPGGKMIPRKIVMKIGFITDSHVFDNHRYFASVPYGIDFSPVQDWPFYSAEVGNVPSGSILPETATVKTIDLYTCEAVPPPMSGTVRIAEAATIYGLCGWFEAELSDSVTLRTGPFDEPTHWQQLIFPLSKPLSARQGAELTATIHARRGKPENPTMWQWSLSDGNVSVNMDNFLHTFWLAKELPQPRGH